MGLYGMYDMCGIWSVCWSLSYVKKVMLRNFIAAGKMHGL